MLLLDFLLRSALPPRWPGAVAVALASPQYAPRLPLQQVVAAADTSRVPPHSEPLAGGGVEAEWIAESLTDILTALVGVPKRVRCLVERCRNHGLQGAVCSAERPGIINSLLARSMARIAWLNRVGTLVVCEYRCGGGIRR